MQRVDAEGQPIGEPQVDGTQEQRQLVGAPLRYVLGAPSYPDAAVAPGDGWRAPFSWAVQMGDEVTRGRRDVGYVLEDVDQRRGETVARVRFGGTTETQEIGISDDRAIGVRVELRGALEVSTADGVTGRGAGRGDFTYQVPEDVPEYALGSMPRAIAFEWCMARADASVSSVGCDEGSAPSLVQVAPTDRPAARVYEGEACEDRLASMRDRLEDTPPPSPIDVAGVELPTVEEAAEVPGPGAVVYLGEDGPYLYEEGPLEPEEIAEQMESLSRNWEILHPGTEQPPRAYLRLSGDAAVDDVLPVIDAVPDGLEVRLLVEIEDAPEPPEAVPETAPAWLARQVEDLRGMESPSDRTRVLSRMGATALTTCEPAIIAFAAAASAGFRTRWERLSARMPEAAEECRCRGLDVDAIETVLMLVRGDGPVPGAVPLVVPETRGRPLRLADDATVADLAEAMDGRRTDRGFRIILR